LSQALAELETPWGPLSLSASGLSLAAAVLLGWYVTLALTDVETRRMSRAYAAAWTAASTQLLRLHWLGTPTLMPVAAASMAVVGVALVSPREADIADTLDHLSPALALAFSLSAAARPTADFAPVWIVGILGALALLHRQSSGQAFFATCLTLVALAWGQG